MTDAKYGNLISRLFRVSRAVTLVPVSTIVRSQNGGQGGMHHGNFFVFDRNCTQSGIYTAETKVEEGNTVKRGT